MPATKFADLYRAVGSRVRAAREQAQFTQDDLASRIGLKRTSITNIEAGRQQIQLHTLSLIAQALNVTVHSLIPTPEAAVPANVEKKFQKFDPKEREWLQRVVGSKPNSN